MTLFLYINDSNNKQFFRELCLTDMTFTELLETMEYNRMNNTQTDYICVTSNFIGIYANWNMRTLWSDYPDVWTSEFDDKWNHFDLWTYFDVGITPYTLKVLDFLIETLTSSLNHYTMFMTQS